MWHRTAGGSIVLLAAAIAACSTPQPKPGSIDAYVQQARRQQATTVSLPVDFPEAIESNLDQLIRLYDLVLVSPTRLDVACSRTEFNVITWHVFHVLETLSGRHAGKASECRPAPLADLHLREGEIAVPSGGGAMTINGISVQQRTWSWRPSDAGGRYVFFATDCGSNTMRIALGSAAVFRVTMEGRIVSAYWNPLTAMEYKDQMEALGTLDNLKQYLRRRRSG